jgi:hypothetical protein
MTKKNSDPLQFFKNKDGKWAVVQLPNNLLLGWLFLTIIQLFITGSVLKSDVQHLASAVLFAWAYLEVIKGDSQFRQLFGGVILASIIFSYFA